LGCADPIEARLKAYWKKRLPRCDDEQAREPKQDLAIVAGLIGPGDPGGVVGQESLSRPIVERVEKWPQERVGLGSGAWVWGLA